MNASPLSLPSLTEPAPEAIAGALETCGYVVLPAALPAEVAALLHAHCRSLGEGNFNRAGIGRDSDYQRDAAVRSDRICWLDPGDPGAGPWFSWIEDLRLALNRRLFLGLFDYECHYACYPPGAFYRRHRDSFRGSNTRRVSTILYLNPDWQRGDGGELLLYDPASGGLLEKVEPLFGRMVLFLSEDFPHEVLPASKPRYSLTGWFRVNGSRGDVVDPAG